MAIKLSARALDSRPSSVAAPRYEHDDLSPGILHFGVGNFHRAHQAVYLDDLFGSGRDHDWALVGAGVLPSDEAMRERLGAQDWLTTVVEQDSDHMTARVTAPMVGFVTAGDPEALLS
ncbi:MAG: mannitol dehydrogenase family protein, partial [Rhizobiales bacterium]|nr:mannitol dehydrogenase family protein [Hyphomicrobiales bacterium]